jgi:hypothetical protein
MTAWIHHQDPEIDETNWLSRKAAMQAYRSLTWKSTERGKSVDFLDLTIKIKSNGTLGTKLFEKAESLSMHTFLRTRPIRQECSCFVD